MNGKFRFVFDWSDGRVMSERAVKIVAKDESSKFDPDNVVVINPEDNSDEEKQMREKMEARLTLKNTFTKTNATVKIY